MQSPTMHRFLFFFLFLISATPSFQQKLSREIQALLTFKNALDDPNAALSGWNPNSSGAPCSWRGVSCDITATPPIVVDLRLPKMQLRGPISSSLSLLSHLKTLSLRDNHFTGSIPLVFSSATSLRSILLQNNFLSGPLPDSFPYNLSSLLMLNLAGNQISGPIPDRVHSRLRYLDLSSNNFTGVIPPALPYSAPNLQSLNLSFNRLRGSIPLSIGQMQSLFYLWLDWNLLEGPLPAVLANCTSLLQFGLEGNNFSGVFPAAIGAIPSLQVISIAHNSLSGSVLASMFYNASGISPSLRIVQMGFNYFTEISPPRMELLGPYSSTVLETLDLKNNKITGNFPEWLTNMSTLTTLDLSGNLFDGQLSPGIGMLTSLKELRLGKNMIYGSVPAEIGKCSLLHVLDLSDNKFSGDIPKAIGDLKSLKDLWFGGNLFSGFTLSGIGGLSNLQTLSLKQNKLTGALPDELLQMKNLTFLDLSGNKFTGVIPDNIGNLVMVQNLNLSSNGLNGGVPVAIGNLKNLKVLDLSGQKNLSGELPNQLFGLPNLQVLSLADNMFSERVPQGFSSLSELQHLNLSSNSFMGTIPATYGYLKSLSVLSLSNNNISGEIPPSLADCTNLTTLELRFNHLSGNIPVELSQLTGLKNLDLGQNDLSGQIPPELSRLSSLITLLLDGNDLSGDIPKTLIALSKLRLLDLSTNSLSGTIPKELDGILGLVYLNVSHNHLVGDIPPMLGAHFNSTSLFSGNDELCGQPLGEKCEGDWRKKRKKEKMVLMICIVVGTFAILAILCCFCCLLNMMKWRQRFMGGRSGVKKRSPSRGSGSTDSGMGDNPKLVMFGSKILYTETLDATRQFDEEAVLSRGRHGLVFKACFNDGTVLSILRLPSTSSDGTIVIGESSFRKEAETLGKIKHRNLTVLRGYYAGPPPDVRLLVYDYMPNGNLATLLQEASHQDGHVLNWPMRHLIALGVARGLAFLHASNVIHSDVKPQNILFDADFEAHLSDFGLDQMAVTAVASGQDASSSTTLVGSLGYTSAEVSVSGVVSKEGDVYSFGIVLLELLTGKRPVMFAGGDEDIVKWVKRLLQRGQIGELLEPGLLELDPESSEWEEFLLGVKVGLLCTALDPADRPSMADIVFMLEGCRVGPDIPSSADPTSQTSPV
ncbi:Receptor-like protein kinase [Zostera marina]|uniref:non-specific serine/threonine protein kinase n=1 Tax=Zostera marina TaxID=29655 RepID=A0A0K9PPX5_ZOSMR|nr:Receptor-like protein kinase [Zostera marina]